MRRLAFALLCCLLSATPTWAADARVVVTLKPLHALAAQVMEGAGMPRLLVSGAASEHGYALKPSDAKAVAEADLVVLVDESFETYLRRPLALRRGAAGVLRLMGVPGMTTLPQRRGGAWESDAHSHERGSRDTDRSRIDGHVWLDPANGQVILRAVAAELARLDPGRATLYAANAARAIGELQALDRALANDLQPVKARPFIVFHDAFQYFEARYGLNAVGSITVDPERRPGARRVSAVRAKIAASGAACVFREPQFTPALVATLIEGTPARSGEIDPIGAGVPEGPGAYAAILRNLAAELRRCLT